MCSGCYAEYGSPTIDTPAVRAAAEMIGRVCEVDPVGGLLHIVIDDFNIGDDSVEWCQTKAAEVCGRALLQVESDCINALAALTVAERASALGLYDGFWTPPDTSCLSDRGSA